jgi:hypothetical protein
LTADALPGISFDEQLPDGKGMPNLYSGLHPFISKTLVFEGKNAAAYARLYQLQFLGLVASHDSDRE